MLDMDGDWLVPDDVEPPVADGLSVGGPVDTATVGPTPPMPLRSVRAARSKKFMVVCVRVLSH